MLRLIIFEQVGKLNVYRNAGPELATLHLSDRLMVQLIKIDRLGPRLEGMLYKAKFEESFGLVDDVSPNPAPNGDFDSFPCCSHPRNLSMLGNRYRKPRTSRNS